MATLEELQAQLTALTQRVNEITAPPDDYYTHRFSGEEIDNAVGRVADTPGSGAITAGDVGAAPSGFGWGNVLRDITVASREETYEEFCAKVDAVISAMPDKTAALVRAYPPAIYGAAATTSSILHKANSNYCVLFNVGAADSTSSGWRMYKDNGTWYPFEMVNPPMKLGVEYRTTERYNGKPVYVQNVNCGALLEGPKLTSVTIPNVENVIRFFGMFNRSPAPYIYGTIDDPKTVYFRVLTGNGGISIVSNAGSYYAGQPSTCEIYYTKSVD